MSYLEAIHLLKERGPDELSAEQLATIRAAIQATPSILTTFKGGMPIEQFLAEAEAAVANEAQAAAAQALNSQPRAIRNWASIISYAAVLTFFAGVGWYIYQLFPDAPAPLLAEQAEPAAVAEVRTDAVDDQPAAESPAESVEVAVHDQSPAEFETAPKAVELDRPRIDASQFPIRASHERNDEHHWNDWSINVGEPTVLERSQEWYRTTADAHGHGFVLSVTGGPLTLTRQLNEGDEIRFLQLQVRPEMALREPGKIVVSLNDEVRAEYEIGKGTTPWPAYVELRDAADRVAMAKIEFVPARPDQRITWVRIEPVASQGIAPLPPCRLARQLAISSNDSARLKAIRESSQRSDVYTQFVLFDLATGGAPNAALQAEAMLMLIDRKDPAIRQELVDYLQGVEAADILIEAFKRLAQRPFPESMPLLTKSIQHHEDATVRRHAVMALRDMEAEAATPLLMSAATGDADPKVQIEAMVVLVTRNNPAIRQELANYLQTANNPEVLRMALNRIFNHPFEEFRPLLANVLLQQQALDLRQQAVHGLRRFNSPEATQALLDAWNKNDPEMRPLLVESLSRREHPAIERLMINVLSGDEEDKLKIEAAKHFNAWPSEAAIPVLRNAIQKESKHIKRIAGEALKKAETVLVHQQ